MHWTPHGYPCDMYKCSCPWIAGPCVAAILIFRQVREKKKFCPKSIYYVFRAISSKKNQKNFFSFEHFCWTLKFQKLFSFIMGAVRSVLLECFEIELRYEHIQIGNHIWQFQWWPWIWPLMTLGGQKCHFRWKTCNFGLCRHYLKILSVNFSQIGALYSPWIAGLRVATILIFHQVCEKKKLSEINSLCVSSHFQQKKKLSPLWNFLLDFEISISFSLHNGSCM